MAEIIRVPDIDVADWQARLGEIGGVAEGMDDIDQCIQTILGTPRGALVHDPDFGCDLWKYLDWPPDQARAHVVREIVDAIERFDPRVEVLAVTFGPSNDDPAAAVIEIARRRRGAAVPPSILALQVAS